MKPVNWVGKNSFRNIFVFVTSVLVVFSCSNSPEIVVQDLQMEIPLGQQFFVEELLPGEINDLSIQHIAISGPQEKTVQLTKEYVNMFLFVKGNASLLADSLLFQLEPESIAIPFEFNTVLIKVPEGEELHYLQFSKKLSEQDLKDLETFPAETKHDMFFTRFEDCEPYTEKIKSPNTISRTVLPENIIPRVALGTVEAPGPDEVGAHEHGMLDQLFLGLTNNNMVVHAEGASAELKEYSILHIPLGSSHGVTVGENNKMYYMWMDFFATKEGQEWLKTHKPISKNKKDY